MISSILSRLVILVFGTLYPAYASYKAVKTKNVREYVKWMMYWIVFALFTCIETFTDVFLSWFPFYYEIKIILVIWLLSPATKGSSILYRKFVHPMLSSREQEIDEYISKAKEQSYRQVLDLGSKGMNALMQTAIKSGGGLVSQLRKSYSLSDLTQGVGDDVHDGACSDALVVVRRRIPAGRAATGALRSNSATSAIYFSEMDVRADGTTIVRSDTAGVSLEDISSGYSSGEGASKLAAKEALQRSSSLTRSKTTRVTRSSAPKKTTASDESDDSEVFDTNIIFVNDHAKNIRTLLSEKQGSSESESEFFDSSDSMHGKIVGKNDLNLSSTSSSRITACHMYHPQNLEIPTSFAPTVLINTSANVKNLQDQTPLTRNSHLSTDYTGKLAETKLKESATPTTKVEQHGKTGKAEISEQIERGGKYNKKAAPLPPKRPETDHESSIKATLVLQPGVVRKVGDKEVSSKEIFLQSPKLKRKNQTNKSQSKITNKMGYFGNMLKLPKIGQFHFPKIQTDKRSSWHELFSRDKRMLHRGLQSKSDNNIPRNVEDSTSVATIGLNKTGSHLSIRSLTESPLSHRRLKILKRYVDEDID